MTKGQGTEGCLRDGGTEKGGSYGRKHLPIHLPIHPSILLSVRCLQNGQELLHKRAYSSFIEKGSFHKYVYLVL